ncbi:hypothetical protein [Streptomyces sp. AJS327]|nr:hypothetical protein [Streptomyces sp. AJS327]
MLRVPDWPLVSCSGSLDLVDMPLPGRQLELDVEPQEQANVEPEPTMALF